MGKSLSLATAIHDFKFSFARPAKYELFTKVRSTKIKIIMMDLVSSPWERVRERPYLE
jgi:hypothetical protein